MTYALKRTFPQWWLIFALLVAAAAIHAPVAGAQTIRDVPVSHWAYEAVRDLVDRGYLALEDNAFQGDRPVDRFTLASVVARILREIETGAVVPQSQGDVELLRRVVDEFRADLVEAYARIEQSEGGVESNRKSLAATDEKVTQVIELVTALQRDAADLASRINALNSRLDSTAAEQQEALASQVAQLQERIDTLAAAIDQSAASVLSTAGAGQQSLRGEVMQLIEALKQEHAQRLAQTDARLDALEQSLQAGLEAKSTELGSLEGELQQAASSLGQQLESTWQSLQSEAQRINALQSTVAALTEELDELRSAADAADMDIQSQLNAHAEALATQQLAIDQLRSTLEARLREHDGTLSELDARLQEQSSSQADLDARLAQQVEELSQANARLMSTIEALEKSVNDRVAQMGERVGAVERQLLAMQSQIGLSEEQLAALSDRLMERLDSQYQQSFLLAGNVANELAALKQEFAAYKERTEAELARAGQAQTFAIIGALLGLVGLVN